MKWENYLNAFEEVLNGNNTAIPYNDPAYIEYVKLNSSRMNRWMKRGNITDKTQIAIAAINSPQKWILITEPWCGDAAHMAPFIQKMTAINPLITFEIQLRESSDSEIDAYLTNGGKAMPKLIIRDENNDDLFTWGPRTADFSALIEKQKIAGSTPEKNKAEQQFWYNTNAGSSIQKELIELIQTTAQKSVA
jgi:hypothetical protein